MNNRPRYFNNQTNNNQTQQQQQQQLSNSQHRQSSSQPATIQPTNQNPWLMHYLVPPTSKKTSPKYNDPITPEIPDKWVTNRIAFENLEQWVKKGMPADGGGLYVKPMTPDYFRMIVLQLNLGDRLRIITALQQRWEQSRKFHIYLVLTTTLSDVNDLAFLLDALFDNYPPIDKDFVIVQTCNDSIIKRLETNEELFEYICQLNIGSAEHENISMLNFALFRRRLKLFLSLRHVTSIDGFVLDFYEICFFKYLAKVQHLPWDRIIDYAFKHRIRHIWFHAMCRYPLIGSARNKDVLSKLSPQLAEDFELFKYHVDRHNGAYEGEFKPHTAMFMGTTRMNLHFYMFLFPDFLEHTQFVPNAPTPSPIVHYIHYLFMDCAELAGRYPQITLNDLRYQHHVGTFGHRPNVNLYYSMMEAFRPYLNDPVVLPDSRTLYALGAAIFNDQHSVVDVVRLILAGACVYDRNNNQVMGCVSELYRRNNLRSIRLLAFMRMCDGLFGNDALRCGRDNYTSPVQTFFDAVEHFLDVGHRNLVDFANKYVPQSGLKLIIPRYTLSSNPALTFARDLQQILNCNLIDNEPETVVAAQKALREMVFARNIN